jgi:hypothetical protein
MLLLVWVGVSMRLVDFKKNLNFLSEEYDEY